MAIRVLSQTTAQALYVLYLSADNAQLPSSPAVTQVSWESNSTGTVLYLSADNAQLPPSIVATQVSWKRNNTGIVLYLSADNAQLPPSPVVTQVSWESNSMGTVLYLSVDNAQLPSSPAVTEVTSTSCWPVIFTWLARLGAHSRSDRSRPAVAKHPSLFAATASTRSEWPVREASTLAWNRHSTMWWCQPLVTGREGTEGSGGVKVTALS